MSQDTDSLACETPVCIPALDGLELGGILFDRRGPVPPQTAVVLNCGGGISALRYRNFARYLGAAGIPVLTYDYRGIGASRPKRLRGFRAAAEDWTEYDCAGAIAWMHARYPYALLVGLGHSIGTLLFGGAPNVGEISRFVFIGAHTGYNADYLPVFRLPMTLLWHGLMPALTRAFGYFPGRALRLGEDIPAGIALQWAARKTPEYRSGGYQGTGARTLAMLARMASVRGSALVVSFSDDPFATEAGTRRLLSWYPRIDAQRVLITPADAGVRKIGHFGFFRRSARERIWPVVLEYLQRNACGTDDTGPAAGA